MTQQNPNSSGRWQSKEAFAAYIGGVFLIAGIVLEQANGWISSAATVIRNAATPSLESVCDESLPKIDEDAPSKSDQDIDNIREIVNACTSIIEKGQNDDYRVYLNRGRAIVLLWSLDAQQSQPGVPEALDDFKKAAELSPGNARALFYRGFSEDFNELVSSDGKEIKTLEKGRNCPLIHNQFEGKEVSDGRYTPAIDKYLDDYKSTLIDFEKRNPGTLSYRAVSSRRELPEEEAYILIELGHWLNNRDRNKDLALVFYKIVLAHYGNSKHSVTHNALASIGVANFSKGNTTLAKDYFYRALEIEKSSEIYNNLGSALARSPEALYEAAADAYAESAEREDEPGKKYSVLISRSYALLLEGILKKQPESPDEALIHYDDALLALEAAKSYRGEYWKEDELFLTILGIAKYHRAYLAEQHDFPIGENTLPIAFRQEARDALLKAQSENTNSALINGYLQILDGSLSELDERAYHLNHVFANPIPHDIGHDAVIDVHHENFYCFPKDPRVSSNLFSS